MTDEFLSAVERYELLPKNEDFVFDFNQNETPLATTKNFPALVGSGAALSYTQLPGKRRQIPCTVEMKTNV